LGLVPIHKVEWDRDTSWSAAIMARCRWSPMSLLVREKESVFPKFANVSPQSANPTYQHLSARPIRPVSDFVDFSWKHAFNP